ncbi:hypothetical protein KIW84_045159 [Lathyrus oleraceus]|uniref:Uncharacterized protein n=1 Tax=Pisum sativum TaxID=3888 RepID=A0A9D4XME9_PEA|nr:hypothetical protein KIW84_045159 [Pisum sativum]
MANHNLGSNVDGHIWVEYGVKDMPSKVLKPDVDQFSECKDYDITNDDDINDDGGIRVEINGKSLRFKVMGSKSPKKIKSPRKMNIFVPTSVLRVISKRNTNNVESQDVDYDSEELESSDSDDNDNEKQPKPKYEKFRGELLNKDFQLKLGI